MEPRTCPVCDNLLGYLPPGKGTHEFCSWAKPADWKALQPYFKGNLDKVIMGGE